MNREWYVANVARQQFGPYTEEELRRFVDQGRIRPDDLAWRHGMPDWQPVRDVFPEWDFPDIPPPPPPYSPDTDVRFLRLWAGLLALAFGALGVHKFWLGFRTAGLIICLTTILSCGALALATWILGIVEGIIYLSTSDSDFYYKYVVKKQEWF
ncbi:MAG: hypothetical protein KatS3mg110_4701 [Pirellulaceae bacterium]|nr:MAG: hypothetical protein KatS3mg110_3693 [Pirellulaceae bacterium]GIW96660.1 MAG: hypothetical protein KatS3mg110_4701 [Pirellulaceae bacterium]